MFGFVKTAPCGNSETLLRKKLVVIKVFADKRFTSQLEGCPLVKKFKSIRLQGVFYA